MRLKLNPTKEGDVVDITSGVNKLLSGNGLVTVFVPGSTGAVTTIEFEPGVVQDLRDALQRLFPKDINYAHELAWHDGNGHSHVRAAFLKPSISIPFEKGKMLLGTWQQLVFVELDNKPRNRELIVVAT